MKTKPILVAICIITMLFLTSGGSAAPGATSLGTAFTYQGRLDRDGTPYAGTCDFYFSLWDAAADGSQVGTTVDKTGLLVSNGLFTTQLDFGAGIFNGDARWLEISVQCPGDLSSSTFTRQELTAAPNALYANSAPWSGLSGRPAGLDDGDNDTTYTNGYGLYLSGDTFSVNQDEVQFRVIDSCPAGSSLRAIYEDGTASCETDDGTVFSTGNGLSLSLGVLSIDPTYTQRRISSVCMTGSSIREIMQDGTVVCETDDGLAYLAGSGISLVGNTFSIDPTYTQRRVNGVCPIEQMIYFIGEDGNVYCDTDDNTTYSAGNGLSLAATTFSVDSAYTQRRVSSTCAAGSSIREIMQDGTVICETDDGTAYLAGSGISLAGNTFSIDSTYTQRRVSSTCVAGNSIRVINENGTVTCETDDNTTYSAGSGLTLATTTFSVDSAYTQRRVSDSCAVGSSIRAINEDGSVDCQSATPGRPVYAKNTLETEILSGWYNSIAIGADGLALIAYYNIGYYDLRVAHCNDIGCTSSTTSILDTSTIEVGEYPSIAIGPDGLGLISYYDKTNGNLKIAHCSNTECTSATISTVASDGNVGDYSSITIGSDGLGLVSYLDSTNGDLKVGHCSNTICSSIMPYTLESTWYVGIYSTITIGSDGLGLISYQEASHGYLKVAHCNDGPCSYATITTIDSTPWLGEDISITLGSDGLGLISYYDETNGNLKVAHCSNITCTSATINTLDSSGDVGASTSIITGQDGFGLISYYDVTNTHLKVAHCSNVLCSSATYYTVDADSNAGTFSSITIGVDGYGLISYYNAYTGELKVIHCSNALCIPYFRTR